MNLQKLEKDDLKFQKLYDQVYEECYKELANSLKPFQHKIIKLAIILAIIDLTLMKTAIEIIPLSFLILFMSAVIIYPKSTKTYLNLYKTKVLARFIQLYNKNLNYNHEKGITASQYKDAEFEKFDTFHSNDLIYGKIDNRDFQMSQIYTEKILLDPNDRRNYIPLFGGFFAMSSFDNLFDGTIKIRTDLKVLNILKQKNKIHMDSQEFEKYFEVTSTNKLQTMQVLTSDIMNKLVEFQKNYNIRIELTIKKHKIYIRFHCESFLNPPLFSVIDYKTLLRDYNLINFISDISRDLIKATAETKI